MDGDRRGMAPGPPERTLPSLPPPTGLLGEVLAAGDVMTAAGKAFLNAAIDVGVCGGPCLCTSLPPGLVLLDAPPPDPYRASGHPGTPGFASYRPRPLRR